MLVERRGLGSRRAFEVKKAEELQTALHANAKRSRGFRLVAKIIGLSSENSHRLWRK
jgi:hypothetical protein